MYPVIIIEIGPDYQDETDRLPPVATLEQAKQATSEAGYRVIDTGQGGQCETNDTWDGTMAHIITISKQ